MTIAPADFASADRLRSILPLADANISAARGAVSQTRESKLRETERSDMPGAISDQEHRNDDQDFSHLIDSQFLSTERHQNHQKGKYLYVKAHAELHEAIAVPQ